MSATASINLNITEGMIANAISVAIAEAFSPEKKDQVLRDVVRAHLTYKQNSYDRETMLSKAVGDAIREQASLAVKARMAEVAPDIRAVVDRALGPKFTDSVLAQLEAAISTMTLAGVRINASAIVVDNDE